MMSNFNTLVEMRMMRDMGQGLTDEEINDLDMPERKEYRKTKAKFMIATMNEAVAERRRLSLNEGGSTSSSITGSDSMPSVVHHPTGTSALCNSNDSDNNEDSQQATNEK